MTVEFAQALAGVALALAGLAAVYIAWRVESADTPGSRILRGAVTAVGAVAVTLGALLIGQQA